MFQTIRRPSSKRRPHVLIIVQNLPVPLDRRVWLECQALVTRGYQVSVICPKGPGDPAREHLDGVDIYKYAPAPEAEGLAGFAWEFAYSWVRTAWLSLHARRKGRVRRHPGLQPARHVLAARPPVADGRRRQVRLRPPRPQPRAVPVALR